MLDASTSSHQASACGTSDHTTEAILPVSQANEAIDEEDKIFCCSIRWADFKSCFTRQGNGQVNYATQQLSISWTETTTSTTTVVDTDNKPTFGTVTEVQSPSLVTDGFNPGCGYRSLKRCATMIKRTLLRCMHLHERDTGLSSAHASAPEDPISETQSSLHEKEEETPRMELEETCKATSWIVGRSLHFQTSRGVTVTYKSGSAPQSYNILRTTFSVHQAP
ncbi:hypothetical protein T440DRAFT_472947 [Plenodomus tracheiphilus IPT5]|uniref:Uncharacterized protein n=1 Tax=Plenodomus tracheiphilus IPT5 TaxID=1408161 RepID=A0A6A7ARM8_9PLEO|nr:hypothetical protein T440DRAFT_472947 [Plenodomus tracheiphilus IPT5]